MSTYQWVHFIAIDQPLGDEQLEFMRAQSSRASVSRWEFTNEYNYSSFSGDTEEMLRSGYDVHLLFSSYGHRELAFHLPQLPCDEDTFDTFAAEYCLTWSPDPTGTAGILAISPESDAGIYDYLNDFETMLQRIAPVREMLARGDLRPLYLAWLATCFDEDQIEPPVPAGLGQLPESLLAFAEFYELPESLLHAAAQESLPEPVKTNTDDSVASWMRRQSKKDLQDVVIRLLTGAPADRQSILREIQQQSDQPAWPMSKATRTRGDLENLAAGVQNQRDQQEEQTRQIARSKRLQAIAANPAELVAEVQRLVTEKRQASYQRAAEQLAELAEALGSEKGPAKANAIAEKLRKDKPHSRLLISELRKHGFLAKKSSPTK